ncbi:MAG: glutamine synthetase [Firmicutes bacterium]|nr:glutamine synthetase [Bacillota bacterium]
MFENLVYYIPAENQNLQDLTALLKAHPEIAFVSLAAVDTFGHDTDEKIPVRILLDDYDQFIKAGVQTDGSSVLLPCIADISNARVDLIPDSGVKWFIDYNFENPDPETGLPCGTIRIPSSLVHNEVDYVGSRSILHRAVARFKEGVLAAIKNNPYVLQYMLLDDPDDIAEIDLTAGTEMEFYVMTPDDMADRERLHTSQVMKEQYWKRTQGIVRTAMEECLKLLELYGFEVEMGHKEVGGIKPEMAHGGELDHIMEQLEIDWKYSDPMQAADNDYQARYIIKDVFRRYGLNVTFLAKPVQGVAGSGKHVHIGARAILKNGKKVNIFTAKDAAHHFMNPIGFGALMGILKNYEIINPFVSATNDAFNRLKPGFEAPVCVVTSLGKGIDVPSRNRTVLVGLVRDIQSPAATHFELRSPNPKSNTYLVLASSLVCMLDGINACLRAEKDPVALERSLSKEYGREDFYLEKDRRYRTELNIFTEFSDADRARYYGKAPATVWENITNFDDCADKTRLLIESGVMTQKDVASYKAAVTDQWVTDLHDRILDNARVFVRSCKKITPENGTLANDLDEQNWMKVNILRSEIAKDSISGPCIITRLSKTLEEGRYHEASRLQLLLMDKLTQLDQAYRSYKRNLL